MLTVRKDEYEPKTITLNSDVTPAFWANGLFLWLFPFSSTTDAVTGNMYKYAPASFDLDLEKKK